MAVINSLRALKGVTAPEELKKGDGFTISPQLLLEEEGFNTRGAFCEDYYERPDIKAGIRVLADAYKRGDYVPPIIVKVIDGKVYVREGHRRRRAILLAIEEGADIQFVQVVEHKGDEAEQSLLIATSNDGLPLSPLERAVIYARLANWGWSDQMIAQRVGRSAEHVRIARALLEMPLELKRMIQEGSVAATYAQELYNEHGTNAVEILKKAQEEQASGDDGKKAPKKLTKKSVEKGPRLGKKVVEAMHRGVSSITSRLDNIKPNDDGETFTLTLSREDVDAFQELKAKLAELEPKTDESNEDQQELDLAGNQ